MKENFLTTIIVGIQKHPKKSSAIIIICLLAFVDAMTDGGLRPIFLALLKIVVAIK